MGKCRKNQSESSETTFLLHSVYISPVYTTLNFWYGTDKIGTRTTFGSWTTYLGNPIKNQKVVRYQKLSVV
jgi:hypothetical protein